MAQKAYKRNDREAQQVKLMVGLGIRHEDIARVIGISDKTLRKYYREEIDTGAPAFIASVGGALYKKALGNGAGAVTACIFILKTRAGWKETAVHEHVGVDGGPIELSEARAELMALVAKQQALIPVGESGTEPHPNGNGAVGHNRLGASPN